MSVSYALPPNQNIVPLPAGSTLTFPNTILHTSSTATVIVSNAGSSPGTVNSIAITGAAFQPQGLPLTPFTINPGSALQFQIVYTPSQAATDSGTVAIGLGNSSYTANLAGTGIVTRFAYQVLASSGNVAFTPNQTVTLPDTSIGDTGSITVQVQNVQQTAGTISTITASGPFTVSDTPLLPATLNPNDIVTFTVNFTPVKPGPATGRLQVGNDLFKLAGNGIGSNLVFSYLSGTTTPVLPGGPVIFSPLQVGQSSRLPFTVMNSGTSPATVSSVGVADTHGIFQVDSLPPLPVTLKPGDSFNFGIDFSPATTGFASSTLQVNSQTFTLSGSGTAPPPLPDIQFTGTSGKVDPFTQQAVGISLASPYALPLNGTLTLTASSAAFAPDPSAQFETGGTKVSFTIPANTTDAVFPNGANQIRLQTGTTAGSITIAPSFATLSGFDLTPASAPSTTLTIAPAPPQILNVQISNVTANGFTIAILGFSTTRKLSKFTFQISGASDVVTPAAPLSIDVSSMASIWYNSTASQAFGGQFAVTVPFNVQSSGLSSPTTKLQSISVTATNDQGSSSAVSAVFP
ncbi:MAG TPA: choice-of-anchor D domain-containing protein [Bryobacteraceae bacterium]|nr:choice-of-anchor D domain-containing protein [Bryobacteraceae bacterium]